MRKAFSFILIFAVVALGVAGALAVIPHVHGSDRDHSEHKACPVYQAGLLTLGRAFTGFVFLISFLLVERLVPSCKPPLSFFPGSFFLLRAPPCAV